MIRALATILLACAAATMATPEAVYPGLKAALSAAHTSAHLAAQPLSSAQPKKPRIPKRFSAPLSLAVVSISLGNGTIQYDEESKHMVMNLTRIEPFSQLPIEFTILQNATSEYIAHNGNCKPESGSEFYALFDWVDYPVSTFTGTTTIRGITCNLWELKTPKTNLTLCATDSAPVQYTIHSESYPQEQVLDFGDVSSTVEPYTVPDSCFNPVICPDGKAEVIDAFIFHPENTTDVLADENVADDLGDVLFVCADAGGNGTAFDHYAYVSHYEIEVLSSWGVYEECNGYPGKCLGGPMVPVGREASFGVNALSGQCTNNSNVGSWYSLPADGECQSPDEPLSLEGKCTWRIKQRVKTIDGKCLLHQQGMLASCFHEARLPMAKTRAIFNAAFASDDTAKGGCPAIE